MKYKRIFSKFGLHSVTTGYDSTKMLIISHFVSLRVVQVNASSGTDGDGYQSLQMQGVHHHGYLKS